MKAAVLLGGKKLSGMSANCKRAPPCMKRMSCVSGTCRSDWMSDFNSARTFSKKGLRWDSSAMDCPSSGISRMASAACCKTASGSAAGPALNKVLRMGLGFFRFGFVVIACNTATYGHLHRIGGIHIEGCYIFFVYNHQHTAYGIGMRNVNGYFISVT